MEASKYLRLRACISFPTRNDERFILGFDGNRVQSRNSTGTGLADLFFPCVPPPALFVAYLSHTPQPPAQGADPSLSFLTPPGGGAPASDLYLYQGSGSTFVDVPLYDIFGSTIRLVNPSNPGSPETKYTYDPYGVMTVSGGVRTPWPFLYHGLEQEYPDSWKLYWEPNGNVYNPDPFQLSLSGPQGLGGGGGGEPGSIGGSGGGHNVNLYLDVYDAVQNVIGLTGGIPICWNDSCGRFFLPGLDWLFGGESKPTIP